MHLPNLQKLSDMYHIRAIVERNGAQAKLTADQFGADYASSQVDDVLADPDINMVIITTRHDLHANLACQAAQAGKAIFLEKPMALNPVELENLEAVLRETGVPFMVGFNRRFSPAARRVKEILKERQNPLVMFYRVNAGYVPPDHWTQTSEGGGRIIGEACHMLDFFSYLVSPARAVDVVATSILPTTEHILAGDNTVITLRYEDGSAASLMYTALGAPNLPKEYVEVYSDGKTLVIDDYRAMRLYGTQGKGWSGAQDKGHLDELRAFAGYTLGRNEAPISLEELVEVTRTSFIAAGVAYAGS
jgi:predicted dehydrogenase